MKKTDLLIGLLIGIVTSLLGASLFLAFFTNYNLLRDFQAIRAEQILGKVITLGAILNIIIFFILLKKNKELMARGVVLATIVLAITTLFL